MNQTIGPLTIVAALGYFVATYSSSGIIPIDSPLVVVLSYVPFLNPYIMLTRLALGQVAPWEPVLAVVLLALSVGGALWVAGRLYAAGQSCPQARATTSANRPRSQHVAVVMPIRPQHLVLGS